MAYILKMVRYKKRTENEWGKKKSAKSPKRPSERELLLKSRLK